MDHFEKLKAFIETIIHISHEEWMFISDFIEIQNLKKNDYFLKEGQICNSLAFINTGILIYYKLVDQVEEKTTDIAFEGEWVTNNESRINQIPSLINIKSIDATELLVVKNNHLPEIFEKLPKMEKLNRILIEQAFVKMTQHSTDLQMLSAKERYLNFLKRYPDITNRVPLYHIANYLGIAPKSLSRIRKDIVHSA